MDKPVTRKEYVLLLNYIILAVLLNPVSSPSPHGHLSPHIESHVRCARGTARQGRCWLTMRTLSTMSSWRRPRCALSAAPHLPALMTSWTTLISQTSLSTARCGYRKTCGVWQGGSEMGRVFRALCYRVQECGKEWYRSKYVMNSLLIIVMLQIYEMCAFSCCSQYPLGRK